MLRLMFMACLLTMVLGGANAQPDPEHIARARNATVGLIAGEAGGTDAAVAADMAQVLDDGTRLRILPIQGSSTAQNIADLMYHKGVDVAIAHTDALGSGQPELRYIAKLFQEEVHVLARAEITSLADLAGKPVNIGPSGSDAEITAGTLFGTLHITAARKNDCDTVALDRLRLGEIAAMVIVGGDPVPLLRTIEPGTGLHFLPVPLNPALLATYVPTRIDHPRYPNLVPVGHPVDTVAVGAVLITLSAPNDSLRARRVNRFVDLLFDRFNRFRQPGRHPKWREVNLTAGIPTIARYQQAQLRLNGPHSTVSMNRP